MVKARKRVIHDTIRALVGPRDTWGLSARTKRLSVDFPARLQDAFARVSSARNQCDERPVFLMSAGWRSGSTLLQRMIMEHNEDILMWGEPFAHSNIHDNLLNQFRAFTPEWPPEAFFLSKTRIDKISDTWIANLYPDVECLLDAHRSFYRTLFAAPAALEGRKTWGFKEVRLTIDHAAYFRALYPQCKIVLLYRHPYDAYLSYREWGLGWARTWPSFVSTPYAFGRSWADMTGGYLEGHERVDALLIRYEDLDDPAAVSRLATYLGWPVPRSSDMRRTSTRTKGSPGMQKDRRQALLMIERALIRLGTRNVIRDAGYVST